MDINDLFDGIMKSINQFADEIAEQRLQEKMQDNGLERSEQTNGARAAGESRRDATAKQGTIRTRSGEWG
jgi:hypothetical protein